MESNMTHTQQITPPETDMSVMDAIYMRHAVRDYASQAVEKDTVRALLDAAVHAPSAVDEEPWAFVVLQDKSILKRLSDSVKELLANGVDPIHPKGNHLHDLFTAPAFNAFYNAGTLIVICAKPAGPFVVADCWLAAENLMLAACAKGLGTCPIGLAVTALNTPQWKKELGISVEMTAVAPIIVGTPAAVTSPVARKDPVILSWK
jgi:nitroreductase